MSIARTGTRPSCGRTAMTEPGYGLDRASVPGGVYLMPDEVATVLAALGDAQYWRDPVPCRDCGGSMCGDHQADADLVAAYQRLEAKLGAG